MATSEQSLIIGIDTGGTTTDAVTISVETGEVLTRAKTLTTKHDLAVGVSAALEQAARNIDPSQIAFVSVSTTLATNAVVEGHGSPILVILIGFDDAMVERAGIGSAFSDSHVVRIAGGHDHYGNEQAPLDLDAVAAALDTHGATVGAVAVASAFAVRNTDHERRVRDFVADNSDLAVTISSLLSSALDAPRRALTTALNARLLSRISELIVAVDRSVSALGISAPVLIAKGDGSLAVASSVAQRPIETILSGPAASIVGASALTGLTDFVISDIGGTTTDVAMVRNGRPRLVPTGAQVGDWQTMVEAVAVRTTGLGGDSAVRLVGPDITLGPDRRIPVSLAAQSHPEILIELRAQVAKPPSRDVAGVFVKAMADAETSSARRQRAEASLSTLAKRTLESLTTTPVPFLSLGGGALQWRALDELSEAGLAEVIGFTPTDAAHVLDMQSTFSTDAARAGSELMGWFISRDAEAFASTVLSEVVRGSAGCVLDIALDGSVALGGSTALDNAVLNTIASGNPQIGSARVSLDLDTPVIAVGGPAAIVYREVAERIGAQLVLPDDFAVANAVGAASGFVVARSQTQVQLERPGSFRVVGGGDGSTRHDDGEAAIRAATETARRHASSALAEGMDGLDGDPIIEHVEITRHEDPNDPKTGLYGADVFVELRRRPIRQRG